jgi:arginine exporter protein ArgO
MESQALFTAHVKGGPVQKRNENVLMAACFIAGLICLLFVGIAAIDREADYDRQELDQQISPEQRAEVMGRIGY